MDANNHSRLSVATLKGLFGEWVNQRYIQKCILAWNKCKRQVSWELSQFRVWSQFQHLWVERTCSSTTTKQFSGDCLGVLQFNSILTLSTRETQQIQYSKGSVPPSYHPFQTSVISPCHLLSTWPTGYKLEDPLTSVLHFRGQSKAPVLLADYESEVPKTLIWAWLNFLAWLTEVRKTVYHQG